MKNIFLVLYCSVIGQHLIAQTCPKGTHAVTFSPGRQVQIVACIQNEISLGKQSVFWGAKNLTNDKLYIQFYKVVRTTCGNVMKEKADTYLKPGEFVGGTTFFGELTFETQVWAENCSDRKNRIGGVSYEQLTVENISQKERDKKAKEAKEEQERLAREQLAKQQQEAKERQQAISDNSNRLNKQSNTNTPEYNTNKSQPSFNTTTTVNNAQKQSYQNLANSYLDQAQDQNQDAIMQALNLNLAKTNAIMGGDQAQLSQINQLQNQYNQNQNEQLAQGVTNLVTGVFDLINQNREQKELERQRQEELRIEREREAEEERRRQAELARIRAEKDAAYQQFLSHFNTSMPGDEEPMEAIYYVPALVVGDQVLIGAAPVKVTRNLFHQWTSAQTMRRFFYSGTAKLSNDILISGYYKDLLTAQNAIFDMQSILPEAGKSVATQRMDLNEDELNQYLAAEAERRKQKAEMQNRETTISTLKKALPAYNYPNSLHDADTLSCFVVGYTNNLSGLTIGISNLIEIAKISDGTWPLKQTIESDIKKQLTSFDQYFYIGFIEKNTAVRICAELKQAFHANNFSISDFNLQLSKIKVPKLNKAFWNE